MHRDNIQMILKINVDSPIPVYRQNVDGLRHLLVNGELVAGDSLPPVRQLAADLGVHFNTVAGAYRILADEGWVDLKRKRGAVVLDRKTPRTNSAAASNFSRRLRELVAQMQSDGVLPATIARELRQIAEGLNKGSVLRSDQT
jgi:DNA-binding transcriptional regulator YhcF (GntR family)